MIGIVAVAIETIHVIAITLVFGTIAIVDFRLLGLGSNNRPVTELCRDVLPWTWIAFAFAAVTGGLLFVSHATQYFGNTAFRAKMLLMLLAGINMVVFEFGDQCACAASGDFVRQVPCHPPSGRGLGPCSQERVCPAPRSRAALQP